jgi:predicted metal-dependent phosphotriesterase family hydrolase
MEIQTVSGPIPLENIKIADGYGHVWLTPPEGVHPDARLPLNDARAIEAELKDFRRAGGDTIVDCQPGGCGRDARMLVKLAEVTQLHLIAATGFHLPRYYPAGYWLWSASEEEAAAYFIEELTIGMRETEGAVPATMINVGYDGLFKGQNRVLLEAAAEASRQTGAALLFHTEEGRNVEALPLFLEDRGVACQRLYFCHMDKRPDLGLHRELAQAGILLGYDTFIQPTYKPEREVWPLLKEMVAQGLEGSIAIGLDMASSSMWRHYGGQPGLVVLIDQLIPQLRAKEISDAAVDRLIGQNVAECLARRKTN